MESRKLIVFIHHGSVPGGAPTSLKNLARGLNQFSTYDVKILCACKTMIPYFQIHGIKAEGYVETSLSAGRWFVWGGNNWHLVKRTIIEIFKSPLLIYQEIIFLKTQGMAVLHLNSSILWTSAIAAYILRIPIVWHVRETFNGSEINLRRNLYAHFVKLIAKKVICIGPQEYSQLGGEHSTNVTTIYNSLDETFFENKQYDKNSIRHKLHIPLEPFVYLSLGGDSFRKGSFQLVESVKVLGDGYCLVVAGDFSAKKCNHVSSWHKVAVSFENLLFRKRLIRYLSWYYKQRIVMSLQNDLIEKAVIFPGIVNDVKSYLQSCDVLVFAGTTPHSGRPIYEAWALKKPVIVFDSEVVRKDVENGIDGLIVKDHTSAALAEAIKYLQAHPEACKKMGEAGYRKAKKRFLLRPNTEKLLNIYGEIIGESSI